MAAALVIVVVLVIALDQLSSLLQPLFIAIFFFYLGRPLARRLERYRIPSVIANLATIFVALGTLAALTLVVTAHVDDLRAKAPAYNQQFQQTLRRSIDGVATHLPHAREQLEELTRQVFSTGPLGWVLRTIVGTLVGSLTGTLLFVIFLLFLNSEAETLPDRLRTAYGPGRASEILAVGERINNGIIRYVYVKSVASLVVAVLSTGVLLGYGVDLATLWGTLVFFGNFVPYLGSFVAVILPLVIALLQFGSLGTVATLAIVLVALQLLVSNLLEPLLAGRQLNLSPLVVMLALAFWGWLWGIVGLILAVPIMMSLKLVLENVPATREIAILLSQVSTRPVRFRAGARSRH